MILQGLDGPENASLDGSHGNPEHGGDLSVGQTVVARQDEGFPLLVRKGGEGAPHGLPPLPPRQQALDPLSLVHGLGDRLQRHDGRTALATPPVAARVGRDREQPGRDFGPPVILMRPGNHLDENLLCHFFRRAPVRQQPVGKPKERRGVALEELSRPARIAGSNPIQQAAVGRPSDLGVLHLPTGTASRETRREGEGFGPREGEIRLMAFYRMFYEKLTSLARTGKERRAKGSHPAWRGWRRRPASSLYSGRRAAPRVS